MGRSGNVCGALSGVLMITGLLYNRLLPEEKELSLQAYGITQNILKEFSKRFSTVNCSALTGYKLPEQYEDFAKDTEARQRCHEYVAYAAELLISELQKSKKL